MGIKSGKLKKILSVMEISSNLIVFMAALIYLLILPLVRVFVTTLYLFLKIIKSGATTPRQMSLLLKPAFYLLVVYKESLRLLLGRKPLDSKHE